MTDNNPKKSPSEFAQSIKAKYPEYKDIEDSVLIDKIIQKYPQYKESVDFSIKKKEKSNSTSENQNSVSDTKTTSSASSKNKDSYIYERLGEEYMEANKDKPYTPAKPLNKTKPNTFQKPNTPFDNSQFKLPESQTQTAEVIYDRFQKETSVNSDEKAKVKADLDAEINNEGAWNNVVNLAKDWWNGVFSQEPGVQADKNPLIDNMKSIKKDPKYKGISDNEATKLAYEMEISKREANIKESKARDFLADAQNTTSGDGLSYKDKLESLQKTKLKKVEPELTNLESKHRIYEDKVQSMYSRLDELQSLFEKNKKDGVEPSNELIDEYNGIISNGKSILKEADDNFKRLEKLSEEKGNLSYNLDLMKRDYGKWANFSGRLQNSTLRIASGIAGAYNYGFNTVDKVAGTNQPIKQLTRLVSKEIDNKVNIDSEKLIKPIGVDDIESASDFGRWFFYNVAAEQAPILATTMIPYVGVGLVGASSMGQKHTEMQTEISNGAKYSDVEQALVPFAYGAAETVGAYVDKLMIGRASSVFKSASASERSMISNGMAKEFLKSAGKSMTQEGIEEPATQLFQNVLDKSVLGKDVNVLDGVKDAFASSIMLTGAMNTPGGLRLIVNNAIKPFTYDSKIQNISKEILKFEQMLDGKNLPESERKIVVEQLEKAKNSAKNILESKIKEIGNLSNEEFSEVLRLEKAQANIRSKVLEIRKSENLTQEEKTHIEKALENEFKANDSRRVELLKLAKDSGITRDSIETESTEVATTNETSENNQVTEVTENKEEVEEYDPTEDLEFLESLEVEERQEIEEELVNSLSLQEALQSDNQFTFNGERGTLKTEGNQVVFETETHIHELGNIDEVSESKLLEFGIEVESRIDISINDDSTITIEGRTFTNPNENPSDAITIGKNGDYSVSLLNDKGQKRTIRGQRAEQLAYEYKLKEYENATEQQQQQAIEDAGIERSVRQTSVSQENGNSKQKSKKRGKKQRSLKQNKAPLTKAEREEIELNKLIQEEESAKAKAEEESKRDLFSNVNEEEAPVISEEIKPYEKEITQGKATYNVIKDEKGNFTVNNKNSGKVIPEFIQRKVKNGTKTVKNPIYSKAVALAEGNLTENQINEDNKAIYNEAVKLLSDSVSNASEAVLLAFANGLNISRESVKKEANQKVGGVHWTNSSVAENKLQSITEAAHSIWEEHFGIDSEITDQDIRNEIIDVISSFGSRKEIQDAILDRYNEQTNPYHNLTEEEQFNEWYNSLSEDEKNFYDSKLDIELSVEQEQNLSTEEQIEFYNKLYERTTESLTEKERGEFYGGVQTESELSENARFPESSRKEQKNEQEITSLDLATDEQLQALVEEKSLIDKIISQLDTWEKDIDKFGKETLGVAIPLVVAKETIKAMKLAAKTAKAANDIVKAGLDYLKTTDWYNNLSKADQKKINLRSLKNLVAETIREVKKAEKVIEKTELKLSDIRQKLADQKATRKEVITSVTDFLKNNKVNKNITPTEVNRLIREASEILTKTNPLKAFDEFASLYDYIATKSELRSEKAELTDRQKVENKISELLSKGKTEKEILDSFSKYSDIMIAKDFFERTKNVTTQEAIDRVDTIFEKSEKAMKNSKTIKEHINSFTEKALVRIVDRQFLPKKLLIKSGLKTVRNYIITSKGSSGYAKILFEEAREKIYKGLDENLLQELDKLIFLRRVISIDESRESKKLDAVVHPDNINKNIAKEYIKDLENRFGSESYNDLQNRATAYFDTFRDLLNQLEQSGIISKENKESFFDIDYQPRKYIQFLTDQDITNKHLNNGDSIGKSPIQSLGKGLDTEIVMDSMLLLAQTIGVRAKSIAMNRLNNKFVSEFTKQQEKVEGLKSKSDISKEEKNTIKYFKELEKRIKLNENNSLKGTPIGFTEVFYWQEGERKSFYMEDALYEQYSDSVQGLFADQSVKEAVSMLTLTALVKTIATGNNPTFFITNTPRDLFFIATFSGEYGKNVLKNIIDVSKDTINGIKDIRGNKDSFKKYVEYGGMMDFLSEQGRFKNTNLTNKVIEKIDPKIRRSFGGALNAITLQKIQQYSEIGFRMAVFNKSIENQLKKLGLKSIEDVNNQETIDDIYTNAVASARSTMDFNQGGRWIKDLDAAIPYLNATVQGTRVAVESFNERPVETTLRVFQSSALLASIPISISLLAFSLLSDDEDELSSIEHYQKAMSSVSRFDRVNYMIYFTGTKNKDGEYNYIRIAKPQFLTPFLTASEGIMTETTNRILGIENTKNNTIEDVLFALDNNVFGVDINPVNNVAKVPLFKGSLSYGLGYDFFRQQDISHMKGKVPVEAEGYESKSVEQFYKVIGRELDFSPGRMKVAVESVITTPGTSPYIGMLYAGMDQVFDKSSKKSFLENTTDLLLKSTLNRVYKSTSEFNRKISNSKEVKNKSDEKAKEVFFNKVDFKTSVESYLNGDKTLKEIESEIIKTNETNPFEAQRMVKRFREQVKNKNIPSFVFDVKYAASNYERALILQVQFGDNLRDMSKLDKKERELIMMLRNTSSINRETMYEYNKLFE